MRHLPRLRSEALAVAACLCVPLASAESAVMLTEIYRSSVAEYSWVDANGDDVTGHDGTIDTNPGAWTYDAHVETHTPEADGTMSTDHTSAITSTALSATLHSHGEFLFGVDDGFAFAEGLFSVEFTADIETVFSVAGTIDVVAGTTGWAGYAIDRVEQGGYETILSFEAGDYAGEFGTFPIAEQGLLSPGDYVIYVYSYVQDGGDSLADITIELESMTVPVHDVSWSEVKDRFRR